MNELSKEVVEHILSVQEEKEPVIPPKKAFTAQQYYDILIDKLSKSGVKEEDFPTLDSVRQKLRKDNKLNRTRYPYNGPTYYWRDDREITPANLKDI